MGNGLVFSSKAIVVVFLLPAFACAVLADRQQQIIAHKSKSKLPNALNMICSMALVSLWLKVQQ